MSSAVRMLSALSTSSALVDWSASYMSRMSPVKRRRRFLRSQATMSVLGVALPGPGRPRPCRMRDDDCRESDQACRIDPIILL